MKTKFELRLFVTGRTPRSERAIRNLRRLCEEELSGLFEMVVIDVLDRPELAEEEKIIATPALVKKLPPPERRIIGDLSDLEQVMAGLDLHGHFPRGNGGTQREDE